mgnify:CR=1 FL=1
MKKFTYRSSKFIGFLFLFLLVLFSILFFQKKESFSLEKHNIIIGDSNTRWGINDSILADYQNYSTGGETYLFALTKLKMLDKDNKIDTLMLSFNPHNIINNVWWDDSSQTPLLNRMPALYNYFSFEDHLAVMKQTPKNYGASFIKIGKSGIYNLLSLEREDKMFKFGSFIPVKGKNTNDTIFSHKVPAKICDFEVSYLKKIKKECDAKNIKLILIQPPKNNHSSRYPFYNFGEFYDIYRKDFGNVDFLDFSKMNIPEKYFWDIFHLNDKGADYFSQFLKENKIKNLLNSEYNQKAKLN